MKRSDRSLHEHTLAAAGVRPTARRRLLAELLFTGPHRHFTAEVLWREAHDAGVKVSLATVYNTLNEFHGAGLLRMVEVPGARAGFDTNTTHHHHLLDERTGEVTDLPADAVTLHLAEGILPAGTDLRGIDVVVRVR